MGEHFAMPAVDATPGARAWSAARANAYAGGAAAISVVVAVAAYFDAWTYVNNPSGYSSFSPWQDVALILSWLALTAWLGAPIARAVLEGRHWASAVPPGYELAVAGCLAFGAISLLDRSLQLLAAPARRMSAAPLPAEGPSPWPVHHVEITPDQVHAAFEQLGHPRQLAESPLGSLPFLTPGKAGDELREVCIDIVREMAAARAPRDAEAGKILLEYYVKRSGTHEQVMERLHMSRQTYYLRLRRAWPAVAGRLDELREYQLAHAPAGEPPV